MVWIPLSRPEGKAFRQARRSCWPLHGASSRLDPATETLMERAVDRLFADRTGVVIAHRLKTVLRADDILILEDGCVVEYGPRVTLASDPASRFYQLLQTGLEEALA